MSTEQGKRSKFTFWFGAIILFVIGIALVLNGCGTGSEPYGAINYCSGFILIGMAFLLEAIKDKQ